MTMLQRWRKKGKQLLIEFESTIGFETYRVSFYKKQREKLDQKFKF